MPDPPNVGLFTRFVLENPYPIAVVAIVVGAGLLISGLREGLRNRQRIGILGISIAIAVLIIAWSVTTSGEHAKALTRSLVEATAQADAIKVMSHFTSDATMSFSSPTNPGYPINFIEAQAIRLESQFSIESNRIRSLKGFTQSANSAIVHLSCSTTIAGGYVATPSSWVLRIERQDDDSWKIVHFTWVSILNRPPPEL
ncbi:MAG: hypothetical protein IH984_15585 [Planctomycetes bacterium]|nr:hypothetical protein [Planctomycetota bacterium]